MDKRKNKHFNRGNKKHKLHGHVSQWLAHVQEQNENAIDERREEVAEPLPSVSNEDEDYESSEEEEEEEEDEL